MATAISKQGLYHSADGITHFSVSKFWYDVYYRKLRTIHYYRLNGWHKMADNMLLTMHSFLKDAKPERIQAYYAALTTFYITR